ncbi:hypothetical protein FFWV33_08630 [Flavobacterium faecale]|uniref:DUF4870 domain-containing protein n=1 Tax=Flavobacterium faecale TaxID=1355330 RepID=A0A2S1LCW0_9FLAO|nr:DUF4870 domain-containing protein [Flavobacterium faecale]AWG21592.1 hypothetical protein FFWV33_08630 [Flavobacterium faecale]
MQPQNENNIAAVTHLSALGQYIFPFGNFILPLLLWNFKKDQSEFIDKNGKQVLNFQFSIFLYTILILIIAVPILLFTILSTTTFDAAIENHEWIFRNLDIGNHIYMLTIVILAAILLATLKIVEFVYIIYGTLKASNGEYIKYPMSIRFIR